MGKIHETMKVVMMAVFCFLCGMYIDWESILIEYLGLSNMDGYDDQTVHLGCCILYRTGCVDNWFGDEISSIWKSMFPFVRYNRIPLRVFVFGQVRVF